MSRTFGRLGTVVVPAALTMILAACGAAASGDDGVATLRSPGTVDASPAATASPGSEDAQEALLDFAECMREHGVDMPDPEVVSDGGGGGGFAFRIERGSGDSAGGDAPDPRSDEFQAAQEACEEHLDSLEPPQLDPEQQAEMQERMLAFAECMREHGIDMPDPQIGQGGISIGGADGEDGGPQFERRSDEFQEAMEACRDELGLPPDGGPGLAPAEGQQP